MTKECKEFISLCLDKDPKKRLGLNGLEEIISHPWFADIDKTALMKRQLPVEFKPKLSGNVMDVSNFDKMFTDGEAAHSVMP